MVQLKPAAGIAFIPGFKIASQLVRTGDPKKDKWWKTGRISAEGEDLVDVQFGQLLTFIFVNISWLLQFSRTTLVATIVF